MSAMLLAALLAAAPPSRPAPTKTPTVAERARQHLNAESQPPASGPEESWTRVEDKNAFDDTRKVSIAKSGERPGTLLIVRCEHKKTEVIIHTGTTSPDSRYGSPDEVDVKLRLDSGKARGVTGSISTNQSAIFLPGSSRLVKELMQHGILLVGFREALGGDVALPFHLRGLSDAVKPVRTACGW